MHFPILQCMHAIIVIDLFELWWLSNLVLNIFAFDILSLFITLITLKKTTSHMR